MEEIWKDAIYINKKGEVIDFKGWYQVSNKGRVRSFRAHGGSRSQGKRRNEPMLLSISKKEGNYISVHLKLDGVKRRVYLLHRLVLSTFVSIPQELKNEKHIDVNHIDENKHNNNLENLEWCSRLENNLHGTRLKRSVENGVKTKASEEWRKKHSRGNVHNSRAVVGVNVKTGEVIQFEAMQCADEYFKIPLAGRSVSAAIRGKQKTAYGYKWYYKEDYEQISK